MIRTDKGKTGAWLLLMVYVPMVLLSSLHIHRVEPVATVECHQCVEQPSHPAHVSAMSLPDMDDCVLCRFVSLAYVAAPVLTLAVITVAYGAVAMRRPHRAGIAGVAHGTRGPPCWLFGFQ